MNKFNKILSIIEEVEKIKKYKLERKVKDLYMNDEIIINDLCLLQEILDVESGIGRIKDYGREVEITEKGREWLQKKKER